MHAQILVDGKSAIDLDITIVDGVAHVQANTVHGTTSFTFVPNRLDTSIVTVSRALFAHLELLGHPPEFT